MKNITLIVLALFYTTSTWAVHYYYDDVKTRSLTCEQTNLLQGKIKMVLDRGVVFSSDFGPLVKQDKADEMASCLNLVALAKSNNILVVDYEMNSFKSIIAINHQDDDKFQFEVSSKALSCEVIHSKVGQVNLVLENAVVYSQAYSLFDRDSHKKEVLENCQHLVTLAMKRGMLVIDYSKEGLASQIELNL